MKFTIVERKIKIEDELRQYALRKVEKLDRYFQQDSDTTLTFSELRGKQTVEITVRQVGLVVRAEETTTDMYASVDGAISSIDCMKPALTADGLAPVMSTKSHTKAIQMTALLLPLPRMNCSSPTRNETCIPETATMCINPARDIAQ